MPLITITNFLMVSFWIPSTSANNATLNTPNGSQPTLKPFSCEWSDLNFSISFGPGIAASLCVLIGGFHIIVGEEKLFKFACEFRPIRGIVVGAFNLAVYVIQYVFSLFADFSQNRT